MRTRLRPIVSTRYTIDGNHVRRFDTLSCGHEIMVREPVSNSDRVAIETAKSRRCKDCIKK